MNTEIVNISYKTFKDLYKEIPDKLVLDNNGIVLAPGEVFENRWALCKFDSLPNLIKYKFWKRKHDKELKDRDFQVLTRMIKGDNNGN